MSRFRQQVLSLYATILRAANRWEAQNPAETSTERQYIWNEAKRLFRENRNMRDETQIEAAIREAQARLELAFHYKNPYPRPIHYPSFERASRSALQRATPIYMRSYEFDGPQQEVPEAGKAFNMNEFIKAQKDHQRKGHVSKGKQTTKP